MNSKALYFENSEKVDFFTTIEQKRINTNHKIEVLLEQTYFYPTGGGQDCDFGKIGNANVTDVYKENEEIWHVLDKDIQEITVECSIDKNRRILHMQHHTAQHILSFAFVSVGNLTTTSVKINGDHFSYIDLSASSIPLEQLVSAENRANQMVESCIPVKSYFIDNDEKSTIPLRRENHKISGKMRVVEIENLEYSACGGTHCTNTGMVGMIKIIKIEKINQETRVYFVAGRLARQTFHIFLTEGLSIARQFNSSIENVVQLVMQQAEQNLALQKEIGIYKQQFITLEAKKLFLEAEPNGNYRFIKKIEKNRPVGDLRLLASFLKDVPDTTSMLSTYENGKVSLIISCSKNSGLNANELLKTFLAPFGGKGGGNQQIAQGGCDASFESWEQAFMAFRIPQ